MSVPSLCLCVRNSSISSPNCRLLTIGCKLPLPPTSPPATLTIPLTPKSFIRNAYKKHGVGGERKAGAMSLLPLRTLCLCVRIPSISSANYRLSAVGCKLPLPPNPFPATLARPFKPKSFIRNAYKKQGGGGTPVGQPILAVRLTQPSTFSPSHPATAQQCGARNTGHGSRPNEPAHL